MTGNLCIFSSSDDLGVMVVRNLLIKLLRHRYPRTRLILAAEAAVMERVADFHRRLSWIDDFAQLDTERPQTAQQEASLKRQLAAWDFEMIVFGPECKFPYRIAQDCGIPRRVGFSADARQRGFLTHLAPLRDAQDRDLHWSAVIAAYAEALGMRDFESVAGQIPFLRLPQGGGDPFAQAPGPRVAVHVGGNAEWNRRWPLEKFARLCLRLALHWQASIVLLGGKGEAFENQSIISQVRDQRPSAAIRDLSGCPVDATADCIARADLFVGNDSGPMNMAVAVGTPIVALRGADAENFRPDLVDRQHVVFSGWRNCSRYLNGSNTCDLGCPVAYDRSKQEYPKCMERISLQSVWKAVEERLETAAYPLRSS